MYIASDIDLYCIFSYWAHLLVHRFVLHVANHEFWFVNISLFEF